MSQPAFQLSTPAPDTLAVSGALTFATATAALAAGRAELDRGSQTVLDLSAITQADSAGLATVLALLAHTRSKGRILRAAQVPPGLDALASVSGVKALL